MLFRSSLRPGAWAPFVRPRQVPGGRPDGPAPGVCQLPSPAPPRRLELGLGLVGGVPSGDTQMTMLLSVP
ncbi:hypothetical protein GCM10022255_046140 [Dactylosporangium darangshiense]|uniref:Uncharacterized protein n=1 Tax=Dactylosporangium darangshiense TaxID=579108 RepID=A0ABP8DBC4_9ACTN